MSDVHLGFLELIDKGLKVRCSRSGRYFHKSETNPNGKGGRVSKEYDYWVHDQSKRQSKYKEGVNWQMGGRFRPPSMNHNLVDDEQSVSSDYTVLVNDRTIEVDTSSGNVVINLLAADTDVNGKTLLTITKTTADANSVVITPNGTDVIIGLDGSENTTYSLTDENESINLASDDDEKYYICRYQV